MSNATRVVSSKTPVEFDTFNVNNEFQKAGTKTAQLRQKVTTKSYYPSKKVDNEMNGGLFAPSAFGFGEQEFISEENRVAWILVPPSATEEEIKALLIGANANGCCIYRVLSFAPILSSDQQWSVDTGRKTLDSYANSQVMRYGAGHAMEGELIKDASGRPMYRKTYFWETPREDEDLRGKVEPYISPEIEAELTGASSFAGQNIS